MQSEFNFIADIIEKNSRVLDVGCDDVSLMELLKTSPTDIYNKSKYKPKK